MRSLRWFNYCYGQNSLMWQDKCWLQMTLRAYFFYFLKHVQRGEPEGAWLL